MTQKVNNPEPNWQETTVDLETDRPPDVTLRDKGKGITAADHNSSIARMGRLVYIPFAILEVLLALRVILLIAGGTAENGFINLIYVVTAPFVMLFGGLFANPTMGSTGVFEITTLIAMVVYGVAAWLISRLIWLTMSSPRYG